MTEKLNNTKQRLEDMLLESTRKTTTRFDSNAEDSSEALEGVRTNLNRSQQVVEKQMGAISIIVGDKLKATRRSLIDRINNSNLIVTKNYGDIMARLDRISGFDLSELSNKTKLIQTDSNREFTTLKTMLFLMDSKMKEFEKNFEKMDEVCPNFISLFIKYEFRF